MDRVAFFRAATDGKRDRLEYSLKPGVFGPATINRGLEKAAEAGNFATVCFLIEKHGAEITPAALNAAIVNGHDVTIKILFEKGASPLSVTSETLDTATERGLGEALRILFEKGVDPSLISPRAIGTAVENGFIGTLEVLLGEKGVDPLLIDPHAIQTAAENDFAATVSIVAAKRAERLNARREAHIA